MIGFMPAITDNLFLVFALFCTNSSQIISSDINMIPASAHNYWAKPYEEIVNRLYPLDECYYYGFCIGTYTSGGYASFNLDGKYNFFCGIAGNIDGTQYDVSYVIYGDGKILGTVDISAGTLPKEFNCDVKGIKQLKIVADGNENHNCGVGFANVVLYNDKSLKPQLYQSTSYPSEAYIGRAVQAFQHGSYYEECSQDGKHIDIQGKKYYYGFKIGTYDNGGYACYNLNGEYKTISGKVGFESDIIPVYYIIHQFPSCQKVKVLINRKNQR